MSLLYDIPNRYRVNNKKDYILYLKGYNHYYYFNSTDLVTDTDFADWQIDLYDRYGTQVQANIGTLTKDPVQDANNYRWYTTINIDTSIADGIYNIVVYNNVTTEVKYMQCVKIFSEADVEKYVLIQYRNSTDIYNYNFEGLSSYISYFANMNLVEQQPEIKITSYRSGSSRQIRNQKTESDYVWTLEYYYGDDYTHRAMKALSEMDDILVNGQEVKVKEGYSIDNNKRNSVQKGTIQFYDVSDSTVNYYT